MNEIRKRVYEYKTKNKEGFIQEEIEDLLDEYPDADIERFNKELAGNTCAVIDGDMVIYHCDVDLALRCAVEGRSARLEEWD